MQSTLQRHPGGHAMRPPEHSLSALQSMLHIPLLHELQIAGHVPPAAGVAPHTGVTLASGGFTSEPPVEVPAPPAPAAASMEPPTPPRDGVASGRSAPPPLPEPASTVTPPAPAPPPRVSPPDPVAVVPPFPPVSATWLAGLDAPLPPFELVTGWPLAPEASTIATSGTHTPRTDSDVSQIHPAMQGQGRPAIMPAVRSDEQPAAVARTARATLRNKCFTRNHPGRRHTMRLARRSLSPLDAVCDRRRSGRSRA